MTNSMPPSEALSIVGHTEAPNALLPLALAGLSPVRVLEFDLYIRLAAEIPLTLYRSRKLTLYQADLDRLVERGIKTVYIALQDRQAYQEHVRREVIANEQISPTKKYQVLKESMRAIFEEAFRQPTPDMAVQCSAEFGAQLATVICRQDAVLRDLFSLMDHDCYTPYTHAVNVSTYSLMLARCLRIADQTGLEAIATGALLHDIGKRRIEVDALYEGGSLDSEERRRTRQHPYLGFRELAHRQDIAWGQLMMIYQHHERPDGKGYPVGLQAQELHSWAQLCSVADVFDALTTGRSYRGPLEAAVALDHLTERAGSALDKEMVKCWMELMKQAA
jgi:HD-GYP domain-containing protein (c-di-GMP phosphodiesterase class II)